MNVTVTGPESSGQTWLKSCLSQHPDLLVDGDSVPCEWGINRHYPDLSYKENLIIICRDRTISQTSVRQRGYNHGYEGEAFNEDSVLLALELAASTAKNVLFVSYEGLLFYKQIYFNTIFDWLKVARIKVETTYKDGNLKYLL